MLNLIYPSVWFFGSRIHFQSNFTFQVITQKGLVTRWGNVEDQKLEFFNVIDIKTSISWLSEFLLHVISQKTKNQKGTQNYNQIYHRNREQVELLENLLAIKNWVSQKLTETTFFEHFFIYWTWFFEKNFIPCSTRTIIPLFYYHKICTYCAKIWKIVVLAVWALLAISNIKSTIFLSKSRTTLRNVYNCTLNHHRSFDVNFASQKENHAVVVACQFPSTRNQHFVENLRAKIAFVLS